MSDIAPHRPLRLLAFLAFPDGAISTVELAHTGIARVFEFADTPSATAAQLLWAQTKDVEADEVYVTYPGAGRYKCRKTEGIVVAIASRIRCKCLTAASAEDVQDIEHFFGTARHVERTGSYAARSAVRLIRALQCARRLGIHLGKEMGLNVEAEIREYEAALKRAEREARTATFN